MDYRIYAITPTGLATQVLADKVEQAVKGGITALQYRAKGLEIIDMIKQVQVLQEILYAHSVPLFINDFIDVAKVVEADGVHLGQDDIAPQKARDYLGNGFCIGLSVGNDAELEKFDAGCVDYIGCGAVYATTTKSDAGAPIGLEGLRHIRNQVIAPVVAIGGIDMDTIRDVFSVGVDGVALGGAVFNSDSISETVASMRALADSVKSR